MRQIPVELVEEVRRNFLVMAEIIGRIDDSEIAVLLTTPGGFQMIRALQALTGRSLALLSRVGTSIEEQSDTRH